MAQGAKLSLLMQDALERTLSNPTAIHRWHRLWGLFKTEATEAERAEIQRQLVIGVPDSGEVGFYRATLLAYITGDLDYLARAADVLQTLVPYDADRLMAFSVYQWGLLVMGIGEHRPLVETLCRAQIPALMAHMGQELLARSTLQPRKVDRLERVALLAPYIGTDNHPPTLLVFQHAQLLRAAGLQVHVFASQELRVQHMADYLANNGQLLTPPPHIAQLQSLIPQGVGFTLLDDRFSLQRRWFDTLDALAGFDPDLVFFVGLNSPLTTPLIAARPVLGLSVHAVSPMAEVDVWLTADPTQGGTYSQSWGDAVPPAWGYYHPYRVALKPIKQPVTRAELGLPDGAVVCVSVGARLMDEVNGVWAQRMLELLAHNPNTIWLLVGGGGHLPPALADTAVTQLRFLPHQSDVRSVLRCVDIYANPQRTGGGFSVAEAMAEGLAVVALANADGGDKLGGTASPDLDAFFETLQSFISSPALRRTQGEAMKARFFDKLDLSQSGPSLLAACHLAIARHQGNV